MAGFFHELLGLVRPTLFVEAGAYRADASRKVRSEHPEARVVAFEANPYNHAEYVEALGFAASRIDYLNLALTDEPGDVTFFLRSRQDGTDLRRITGNSSLMRRNGTDTEYEEVTVEETSLDTHFVTSEDGPPTPVCLWVDVEGASGRVLQGGRRLLSSTEVVMIEVEEKHVWEDQWRSLDVIEFFLDEGFVPVTRDIEYDQQYNIVFLRHDVYDRPEVQWALELHLSYLSQHMGVKPAPQAAVQPGPPANRWWSCGAEQTRDNTAPSCNRTFASHTAKVPACRKAAGQRGRLVSAFLSSRTTQRVRSRGPWIAYPKSSAPGSAR